MSPVPLLMQLKIPLMRRQSATQGSELQQTMEAIHKWLSKALSNKIRSKIPYHPKYILKR